TGHGDFRTSYNNIQELFEAYKHMLEPMVKRGKLAYILMQFPPWYDCNEKNINYIRLAKQMLHPLKVAVEFRHESWYKGENKNAHSNFCMIKTSFIQLSTNLKLVKVQYLLSTV